jgi:hypothetical protein
MRPRERAPNVFVRKMLRLRRSSRLKGAGVACEQEANDRWAQPPSTPRLDLLRGAQVVPGHPHAYKSVQIER